MPRKLRNSDTLIGRAICLIASTLSGSGDIPEPPNTTPKNVTLGLLNSHFRLFSVRPLSCNALKTLSRAMSCSFLDFPYTSMSSEMFFAPFIPCITELAVFWKTSDAEFVPKFNRLYLNNPRCVMNVVIGLDSSSRTNWLYSDAKSSLLKTVTPFKS